MMEYLDHTSIPATKAELDLFAVPPTQTAIEGSYEIEFRPIGSIDQTSVIEFSIPPSEHFTDLYSSYFHAKVKINVEKGDENTTIEPVDNFASALFEQVDVYLGTTNLTPGGNVYHYQVFLEDLLFRHASPLDDLGMKGIETSKRREMIKDGKEFDLIFKVHSPLFMQTKALPNGIPIFLRLKRSPSTFGVVSSSDSVEVKIQYNKLSLFIRRLKLFPPVAEAITSVLQKVPAKYVITRNEVKSFSLLKGFASNSIDNVYNGQLPRRVLIGFVSDKGFNANIETNPYQFKHFDLNYIAMFVNGVQIPSTALRPIFSRSLCMREFYNLYKVFNQEEGIPQMNIKYQEYMSAYPLFAFDLTDDGTIAEESGALSLLKRGNVRLEIHFSSALTEAIHMICFAQFDNLIQIDAERVVTLDY